MHRAVQSGMTDMVDLLVKAHADVNTANPMDGWTPFHVAVAGGSIAMVKHLLKLKADPKAVTSARLSAVHIAASYDHAHLIPLLVSPYECELVVDGHAVFDRQFTPLHFAAQACHLATIRALLEFKASVDEVDASGVTPLGTLCRRTEPHPQLEECGKLLLANRANAAVKSLALGNTALHLAALANNVVMCHLIATANKEMLFVKNNEGKTALQVAQREAQKQLQTEHLSDLPDNTRKLLDACRHNDVAKLRDAVNKGGDPNADDGAGNSALYYAILNKSVEMVFALLQAGAKVESSSERGAPLYAAVMTGLVPLVTSLLDKKADPQEADPQWGMKAIHTAAYFGKPEIIRLLLARRCSEVNDLSKGGKTALHWAAQRGQADSIEALLELGADKEARTDEGFTPLHVAAANGRSAIVSMLLSAGADVHATAPDQVTLLHLAAREGDAATVGVVVKAAPDLVSAVTAGGDTVLHHLCQGGSVDSLAHLQGHDSELMVCLNRFGQTPLHLACRHSSLAFVTALLALRENMDVSVEDQDGSTPIYYASTARKEDVIQLLKSRGAFFREEKLSTDAIRFEDSPSFPKLHSATTDALVDYLILTCDKIDDVAFRDHFLYAYRQIMKPGELLGKLIQRFKSVSATQGPAAVPMIRMSSRVVLPVASKSQASLTNRRGSLSGREKKVGLRSSANEVPVVAPQSEATTVPEFPFVLLPENRLRRSVVIRVIRRWVTHSPMDFSSRAAGMGKQDPTKSRNLLNSFSRSRKLVKEGTGLLPRASPMLRGTSPDQNAEELESFLEGVDAKGDEELSTELQLLDKALSQPEEDLQRSVTSGAPVGVERAPAASSPAVAAKISRIGRPSVVDANKPKSSFLDWTPEAAAQQLTLMSKKLWDALSLWEFYDVAFTKEKKDELCPNINALIRHINRVGDWAKTLVLSLDDAKKRGQAITFVIAVMDACLRLRNFSDVMGLVTALQSTSLERLARSWKFVSEDSMATLKRLKDAMDPRGNYKNLRKLMDEKSNDPTIVFVGLTMGDLIHADEVTKKFDERHNWYKYELLARLLSAVPKYQKLKYSTLEEDRVFASMFDKCEFLDADVVRNRSRELEPPEQ